MYGLAVGRFSETKTPQRHEPPVLFETRNLRLIATTPVSFTSIPGPTLMVLLGSPVPPLVDPQATQSAAMQSGRTRVRIRRSYTVHGCATQRTVNGLRSFGIVVSQLLIWLEHNVAGWRQAGTANE